MFRGAPLPGPPALQRLNHVTKTKDSSSTQMKNAKAVEMTMISVLWLISCIYLGKFTLFSFIRNMALGQNYAPSLLKCNIKRVLFKKFSKKFSHHDGIMLNALIILTRRLLYYSREASTDASASSSD